MDGWTSGIWFRGWSGNRKEDGDKEGNMENMTKVKGHLKGCIKTEYSRNNIKCIHILKGSKWNQQIMGGESPNWKPNELPERGLSHI